MSRSRTSKTHGSPGQGELFGALDVPATAATSASLPVPAGAQAAAPDAAATPVPTLQTARVTGTAPHRDGSATPAVTARAASADVPTTAHALTLPALLTLLSAWAERGWLRELDRALAVFLAQEAPDADPLLILGAALASHQLGRGHVCLDLASTLEDASQSLSLPPEGDDGVAQPDPPAMLLAGLSLARWQQALTHPELVGTGPGATPLVLQDARLYLRRYWQYEQDVSAALDTRLHASPHLTQNMSVTALRVALDALFGTSHGLPPGVLPWQKLACALAARSAFSIITGGPGTGKTTTVVRLLAVLQSLALADDAQARPLRIRLAAPTGKAAARLNESIAREVQKMSLDGLPDPERVRSVIPVEVTTLHRLLGRRPDSRNFRHHAGNLLALDVLVVDEASMVDLEMMAAVLAALPPDARLILLGDKDQLASVEAGAVLGQLCLRADQGHYTPATRDWLHAVTGEILPDDTLDPAGHPLDQAIAMLRHSYRFDVASGIGQLAQAINAGDVTRVRRVWQHGYHDLSRLALGGIDDAALAPLVVHQGYRAYLDTLAATRPAPTADRPAFDTWARGVLRAHNGFQVLCTLRQGPCGVDGLNLRIAQLLQRAGLITASEGWYAGRPVMVTRNDYNLNLMNGDVGIALPLPRSLLRDAGAALPPAASYDDPHTSVLRVAFPAGDGNDGIKWVLPSRLQAVETVYAMTVHKSQGSEFIHAALVLPDTLSPVLTRELVYTGITRAKQHFSLITTGGADILAAAAQRRVLRASGLQIA